MDQAGFIAGLDCHGVAQCGRQQCRNIRQTQGAGQPEFTIEIVPVDDQFDLDAGIVDLRSCRLRNEAPQLPDVF